jgi:hypothetical protein
MVITGIKEVEIAGVVHRFEMEYIVVTPGEPISLWQPPIVVKEERGVGADLAMAAAECG